MTSRFVVAGLPIELWRLVFRGCDRITAARLGATCRALRAQVLDQRTREIAAARSAVDAFVDRWETLTAKWDETWSPDAGAGAYTCALCTPVDDRDTADPRTDGAIPRRAWWICDRGTPDDSGADWICDVCAQDVRGRPDNAGGLTWPMRRVDTTQPHVWSVMQFDGYAEGILPSGSVARFRVPDAAVHLIDPDASRLVMAWPAHDPMLVFSDMQPALMPSVRAWMPLVGAHHSLTPTGAVRMLVVCCDAGSDMWGAVALIHYRLAFSTWYGVEDSLEALMARHRHLFALSPDVVAQDLTTWAGEAYIDEPMRAQDQHRSDRSAIESLAHGTLSDELLGDSVI
ncbi:hypothetical protein pdul_cds_384 [Pandoravirus dulcis]|uniref:F-box domain containing protein n=1 Tax=Pandoravirus dulcis TaxID=1349409 RepID=S4VWH0_9VIRU|nr:hypothetical protein pdul_cds_384 [Pandoravirus dulcis]AGO82421.1 hypothetical protein pdul_cds_384 [Pandoravirus dulcis]